MSCCTFWCSKDEFVRGNVAFYRFAVLLCLRSDRVVFHPSAVPYERCQRPDRAHYWRRYWSQRYVQYNYNEKFALKN